MSVRMRSHLRYCLRNYRHNKEHLNEKVSVEAGPQKTIRPFVQKASFHWTKNREHRPQDYSGMGFTPKNGLTAFHLWSPLISESTEGRPGSPPSGPQVGRRHSSPAVVVT